jgi:hypothetical protein
MSKEIYSDFIYMLKWHDMLPMANYGKPRGQEYKFFCTVKKDAIFTSNVKKYHNRKIGHMEKS